MNHWMLGLPIMLAQRADDATVHFLPLGEDGRGSFWEFGQLVWDLLIDCFSDISNTVDSLHTEGDTIMAKVSIGGTQAKAFMGLSSKGLSFHSDHVFVFQFNEADQIQDLTIHWDHAGFVKQLGG